jgi:hypothetical protein
MGRDPNERGGTGAIGRSRTRWNKPITGGRSNGLWNFGVDVTLSPETIGAANGQMRAQLQDWSKFWPSLVPILSAGVREIVGSRGAAVGYPWKPSTDKYLKRKARQGFGSQDLVRTGGMLNDLTSGGATYGTLDVKRTSMKWGSNRPYARAVQFRSGRGKWFVGWTDNMRSQVTEAMQKRVEDLVDAWVDQANAGQRETPISLGTSYLRSRHG